VRILRRNAADTNSSHSKASSEKFLLNILSTASVRARYASHPLWMC
jgi:hypothetical protein